MHRNSLVEMSGRAMHQAVRLALNSGKINDNPMWQELDFSGLFSDGRKLVERIQAFGFTSVPLGPTKQQKQQGGQGGKSSAGIGSASINPAASVNPLADGGGGGGSSGGGGGSDDGQPQHAEGIAIFLGGQRNHPVVIAVDDRRHRPMDLKPGENAQYDDIQQMTLMRRNGLYLLSNDNEDAEGKKAERMVSLRHVEKKKQERKPVARQNIGENQKQSQQSTQDFKHEGDTVNHEIKVTKKKIQFKDGDNSVIQDYDKESKTWTKTVQHDKTNATTITRTATSIHYSASSITGIGGSTFMMGGGSGVRLAELSTKDNPGGVAGGFGVDATGKAVMAGANAEVRSDGNIRLAGVGGDLVAIMGQMATALKLLGNDLKGEHNLNTEKYEQLETVFADIEARIASMTYPSGATA